MEELSPVDILMLDYVEYGAINDKSSFAGFWYYRYESNPQNILNKLINLKLIYKALDIERNLKNTTLPELKLLLKENGLRVSGKKNDLIQRILDNIQFDVLKDTYPEQYYALSPEAKKILSRNEHIPYAHKHINWGLGITEIHNLKKSYPNLKESDLMWMYFEKESLLSARKGDWGLFRNHKHHQAELLIEEDKYRDSLSFIFQVCFLDLSGLQNGFKKEYLFIYEKGFFPYRQSIATLTKHHIELIAKIKDTINISDVELKSLYVDSVGDLNLPFHLFTLDETFQILKYELENNLDHLENIYKDAEKRYYSKQKSATNMNIKKSITPTLESKKNKGFLSFLFKNKKG